MLRAVSAGSNTAAVHVAVLDDRRAATALPSQIDGHYRRRERRWRSLRDARESLGSGGAQGASDDPNGGAQIANDMIGL